MAFQPNAMTFDQGLQRIKDACKAANLDVSHSIVTSRDPSVKKALSDLEVKNVPTGFVKFQLPVSFDKATQAFMSFGAPRTKVPTHSHDEGDGLRVILSGSISYQGTELTPGDWMYIPAGKPYDFEVGPMGVGMFYCYACCCA
jgi:hypothetical protein